TKETSRVAPLKSVLYSNLLPGRRTTRELSGNNTNRFSDCSFGDVAINVSCPLSFIFQKLIPKTAKHTAATAVYNQRRFPVFRFATFSSSSIHILLRIRLRTSSSSYGSSVSQNTSRSVSSLYHFKRRSRSAVLAIPCKYLRIK